MLLLESPALMLYGGSFGGTVMYDAGRREQ